MELVQARLPSSSSLGWPPASRLVRLTSWCGVSEVGARCRCGAGCMGDRSLQFMSIARSRDRLQCVRTKTLLGCGVAYPKWGHAADAAQDGWVIGCLHSACQKRTHCSLLTKNTFVCLAPGLGPKLDYRKSPPCTKYARQWVSA